MYIFHLLLYTFVTEFFELIFSGHAQGHDFIALFLSVAENVHKEMCSVVVELIIGM
jgi:hypothetical protein